MGHYSIPLTLFCSLLVIVGWILGKLLTLLFDPFESMVLFLSGENSTCYCWNHSVRRAFFG